MIFIEVAPIKDVPVIVVPFTLKNRVRLDELPKKIGESVDVLACIDKVLPVNTVRRICIFVILYRLSLVHIKKWR